MLNLAFIIAFFLPGRETARPPGAGLRHDFKLSVCEMVWSAENEGLDLKFYLFQDDFKTTLYGNPDAPQVEQEAAKDYIQKHFNLRINGQGQAFHFHSMKAKNDQVLLQFSSAKIPLKSISKIEVKNLLLIERFKEQINMVYAIFPGRPKMTQMLNATKTDGVFSF